MFVRTISQNNVFKKLNPHLNLSSKYTSDDLYL